MRLFAICSLLAAGLNLASALELDTTSPASIRNASAALAYNLMSYYKNNATGIDETLVGTLPQPLYWWEAGALWGGLVDYWAYTNDSSYIPTTIQALQAQVGPDNNYMPPAYFSSLGNDDQAFWAFAALSAAEYGFPEAGDGKPTWLSLAEAVFNTMVPRWDLTSCGGGLHWQVFESNGGYDYKNSISNGGFFQISARLAHFTGNDTYFEWAERVWNWTSTIGLIDNDYNIYDGSDDTINCTEIDHTLWSYNSAVWLYGSAILYNYTNASTTWGDRTTGILEAMNRTFFSPFPNATNVMFEPTCEPSYSCNNDQYSFKAYIARWFAKSSIVAPFLKPVVHEVLTASANAAAQACSGGDDGVTCGERWYVGGFDNYYGIGQQLSALEVVQALLIADAPVVTHSPEVHIRLAPATTLAYHPTVTARVNAGQHTASVLST